MIDELLRILDQGPLAISTRGLAKRYGDIVALDKVDVSVPEGAVYVLAGSNGAGKTTLMESLLDLVPGVEGTAEVFGLDCRTQGPQARAQIGYVSARQDWGYGWMPVGRLLQHHAAFYPSWDEGYASKLVKTFELPLDRKFGNLSKGYARRVQLALALAHRPPVLLLDEPTDGLDRVVRDELFGILAEHIAETPTTILVATHLIYEIEPFADHLGVLRDGRLIAQLSRDRLHRMLRRYRAGIPEGWTAPERVEQCVVHRADSGREIQWIVWGEEEEVGAQLSNSDAVLRDVAPLTLDDAVLALLRPNSVVPAVR